MNKTMKMFSVAIFALTITLAGVSYADDVTIQLGSGDGFKVLDSGGSPLMDILSNGYVGIGTSPNYKLDVSGDINFTGLLYQNGSAFNGSAWTTSGNDISFGSGNVGIGTSSPGQRLHVNVSSGWNARFSQDASTAYVDISANQVAAYDNGSGSILLLNNSNNGDVSIANGGGNVGIGTASPGTTLHIEHAAASGMPVFIGEGPVPAGQTLLQIKANAAWPDDYHLFTVNRGLTAQFYVLGDGRVVSNGLATHSDERLKENITHVDNSLEKVLQLNGVHFYWKDRESRSDRQQIGLLAQEVEKVFPSTVSEDNEGYKLLNYSGLIAPVIEAIKELKKRTDEHISQSINNNERRDNTIASQREEIDILKAENKTLKISLAALATEISDIKVALGQNNQFGTKLANAGDLGNIGR